MLEQPDTCPVPAPVPLPHGERRVRIRYPAGFTTLCQNDQAGVGDFWWMGRVLNISAKGVGLLVSHPFDPDAVLVLEPTNPSATPAASLQARVVRVEARGPGGWSIGCEFTAALTDADLRTLLG
jgi:PilZ domain